MEDGAQHGGDLPNVVTQNIPITKGPDGLETFGPVEERAPGKIVIRPLKNSRGLARVVGNIVDHRIELGEGENLQTEQLGNYLGERFFDSVQTVCRPEYDRDINQFDIRWEDGRLWNQDDANLCLKEFPQTYEKYHPDTGKSIKECDITNVDDPYFNHIGFGRQSMEGEMELDPTNKRQRILACFMRGSGEVAMENADGIYPGGIRTLMTTEEAKDKQIEKRMTQNLDASNLFQKMQDDRDRMVAVLRLFNVDVNPDLSIHALRLQLYNYTINNETTEEGATYQERFLRYANLEPVELKLRENIQLGINKGEIRSRGGVYEFSGTPIGRTYGSLVEFFRGHANSSQYDELQIRIGVK